MLSISFFMTNAYNPQPRITKFSYISLKYNNFVKLHHINSPKAIKENRDDWVSNKSRSNQSSRYNCGWLYHFEMNKNQSRSRELHVRVWLDRLAHNCRTSYFSTNATTLQRQRSAFPIKPFYFLNNDKITSYKWL